MSLTSDVYAALIAERQALGEIVADQDYRQWFDACKRDLGCQVSFPRVPGSDSTFSTN